MSKSELYELCVKPHGTWHSSWSSVSLEDPSWYHFKRICYAQRSKTLIERKKRPQHVVALEKQLQCEIVCCDCFWTTTTRCGIRETATTWNCVLWLFLNNHNTLWH